MKSLEFLKELQDSIEYLTRIDYVPSETREAVINSLINEYLNDDYKINAIKQDLEVLEIIREVVFKKYQMFYYVSDYGLIDRGFWVSDTSHECTEFELGEEEYNKLKQWLGENEE